MLSSMGFVLEPRQGWHRIRGVHGSKILERGKASVKEAWWTSGYYKQPEKSWLSPRTSGAVGKEGSSQPSR